MDSHTDLGPYFGMLQAQKNQLQNAQSRRGQRPRDREPKHLAYFKFMAMLTASSREPNKHEFHSSFIPPAYAPCVTPITDLRSIRIQDLQLETHHRGRYLALRAITPPSRMTAIMALTEDESGDTVLLQLYQQEDEHVQPATDVINEGTIVVVKEPYYKVMANGGYGLRVDHLSDVLWPKTHDAIVPAGWQPRITEMGITVEAIKLKGNRAVGREKYLEAVTHYSDALEQDSIKTNETEIVQRNRALAYLKTKQFDAALIDVGYPTFDVSSNLKALIRGAEALYGLSRYEECSKTLELAHSAYPNDADTKKALERVQNRLQEHSSGIYLFKRMQASARKFRPPHLDHATFIGPVEVKPVALKGRGLFTTQAVRAGDLLLCEKAFCHAFVDKDSSGETSGTSKIRLLLNIGTDSGFMGAQADLITAIVRKLHRNPSLAPAYKRLFHGDYEAPSTSFVDGQPIVDSFLVERILTLNVFGCPDSSLNSHRDELARRTKKDDNAHHSCGIWTTASYINHGCVSNARRSFIGDMMIIRATKDIEPDTEVTFWYRPPSGRKEAKNPFQHWGFVCDCPMCLDIKKTKLSIMTQREDLHRRLKRAFDALLSKRRNQAAEVERVLESIEKTYSQSADIVPRIALRDPYLALMRYHINNEDPSKALASFSKVLTSLGFVADGLDMSEKVFKISKWGLMVNELVEAFQHARTMFFVHGKITKAQQALEYAKLAYRMVFGEDETYSEE